jgi:type IV pilus assembly protein PilQ
MATRCPLGSGRSRLIVTTDKKIEYNLDRKGEKSLLLTLSDTTILPDVLLRKIDTTHFESALEGVQPAFSSEKEEVSIVISLKEMVPFHVQQTETGLSMDFGQTSIQPPETEIVPLNLAGLETRNLAATQTQAGSGGIIPQSDISIGSRQFTGEPMYLDFINVDVTHILRLINEVSSENIIWDPAIKGRTVSMILKDVPWDQALELILKNNDLAKRYMGDNIVWITTKDKMDMILAEEEAEVQKEKQLLEEEARKREEQEKKAEEEAPLITEFLPVDFAEANEIRGHITLTERGTMSIDTRTNTIIIKDTVESIEEAKKTVGQFDTPVKQIMIEARIVDASDSFSRNLGIQWNNSTSVSSNNEGNLTASQDALDFTANGEMGMGGSFSTNTPDGWASNIGLSFARLSSDGLGAITLDAALAIAESEGKAKTLSAPKVIATEGASATISSGDKIIIAATENVASTTLDATLSLTVTPTSVSYNDYITLDVSVTDDKAPSTSLVTTKSITTTLMIPSGETIVMGGIIKETEADDITGVPVLKDIPGLGWLFKAKTKNTSKSELLIFLTPTVLPTPARDL